MNKKKDDKTVISGLPKNSSELLVQKSLDLLCLWRSNLSLAEFKIFDLYLSRINSRNPDNRIVRFQKGELERLLGVTQLKPDDLKFRLSHLMGTVIETTSPYNRESFRLVSLFEYAECYQDDSGLWQVDLECTQRAMKYFFNVENVGYLRYKLRSVSCLTSRYSYILFCYIEFNRFRKTWEVSVEDLKCYLNCENEDTYHEFKRFNDRLLKRCCKEILEKTECRFVYEPIKKGRRVDSIRFTVQTLSDIESEPIVVDAPQSSPDDIIEFLRFSCCRYDTDEPEFSYAEMESLYQILVCVPDSKLPSHAPSYSSDRRFRLYHYLAQQYSKMNSYSDRKPIKHRLSYLSEMIKRDASMD